MAQSKAPQEVFRNQSCDSYFEMVQSKKKLPMTLQESLTEAFAKVPVSSFPEVPGGKGEYHIFVASQIPLLQYSPIWNFPLLIFNHILGSLVYNRTAGFYVIVYSYGTEGLD